MVSQLNTEQLRAQDYPPPISPLYLPYISLYLPYISLYLPTVAPRGRGAQRYRYPRVTQRLPAVLP